MFGAYTCPDTGCGLIFVPVHSLTRLFVPTEPVSPDHEVYTWVPKDFVPVCEFNTDCGDISNLGLTYWTPATASIAALNPVAYRFIGKSKPPK